jgi:hypothetical protein
LIPFLWLADTLSTVLHQNSTFALHIPQSKTQTFANFHISLNQIRFGYLSNPFEFYQTTYNDLGDSLLKFSIHYSKSSITVLFFIKQILHKIEFDFGSIDRLVCVTDDNKSLYVYIPVKRMPYIYRLVADDPINSTKSLTTLDEDYLDWQRTYLLGLQFSSIQLVFDSTEKLQLLNNLQNLKAIKVIFSSVFRKHLAYTVDNVRASLVYKDFNSIYHFECFASQFGHALGGKINVNFVDRLNGLNDSRKFNYAIEKLMLRLNDLRYYDLNSIFDSIMQDFDNDFQSYM